MDFDVELQLAISLAITDRPKDAAERLEALAKAFPKKAMVKAYQAWLHLREGRTSEAMTLAKQAVALGGEGTLHALDVLAQGLLKMGKKSQAVATLLRAQAMARSKRERRYFQKLLDRAQGKKPPREGAKGPSSGGLVKPAARPPVSSGKSVPRKSAARKSAARKSAPRKSAPRKSAPPSRKADSKP